MLATLHPWPSPGKVAAMFMPDYPIETNRLTLRPFTRGDVDDVYSYRSREDVCAYLFDEPMSRETCAEAVAARVGQVALNEEGDKVVLAVGVRGAARIIGEISLIWRSEEFGQGELGYIFHPDAHGHGYATEASRALLSFGFHTAGLHRIYARCDARNLASAKVMARLGMRQEAHFREHAMVKGQWDEELIWAILEDDWRLRSSGS
jgi:RimJ/RimL family protein N-acetyltransferase